MDHTLHPSNALENGNRTFFTFYSDFKTDNKVVVTIVETLAMSLVFIISLFINISAIVLMAKKKRIVTANCFVLNLFFADLMFISMIPFILVIRWTERWILGDFICQMLFYIICLSGCVTLISLSAVSLERMICIMKITQAPTCNIRVVVCGLLGIWIFSAFTALPMFLFFKVVPQNVNGMEVQICTLVWPNIVEEIAWDISFIILDFLVPGLSIIISYTKILKITKSVRDHLVSSGAYSENLQVLVSQKDFKLFRTLLILMISFFFMWTPVFIIVLLLLIQNLHYNIFMPPSLFFWITTFTLSNSFLNPVLYNINLLRQKWMQAIFCCTVEETLETDTTIPKNENLNTSN
ncbi:hypothetical protein GDO86_013234 [Hymenochirus boettgeri]|uniref:G-protein coupled receptors family 1 profile domain-containing protein n=1 Tax=Hymenochirus boettgeri TaxID=247094 RepID=A0A8T2IXN2_9PIPI|nr:hypothetical protein GDO86_013234 [Hymenochirus boettgeri]